MNGSGLVKSLKRVWKAKTCIGVLGVLSAVSSSSTTAPLLDPMILEVA